MHSLSIAGEKLTKRIRSKVFESTLTQELGWFDRKENGVGALCARLSTDAAYVQGVRYLKVKYLLKILTQFLHLRHPDSQSVQY